VGILSDPLYHVGVLDQVAWNEDLIAICVLLLEHLVDQLALPLHALQRLLVLLRCLQNLQLLLARLARGRRRSHVRRGLLGVLAFLLSRVRRPSVHLVVLGLDDLEICSVATADGLGCLITRVALAVKVFRRNVHSIAGVEAHILVGLLKITFMLMVLIRIRPLAVLRARLRQVVILELPSHLLLVVALALEAVRLLCSWLSAALDLVPLR
jgi:hypothetical protein